MRYDNKDMNLNQSEIFSFENLDAYKLSKKLVIEVYKIINSLPSNERFALGAQLQRAIVSVPSNIAEGCGRISLKEKIHFVEIAFGSLMEAYCQLEICVDLHYIQEQTLQLMKKQFIDVSKLLKGLRYSYIKKLSDPNQNINK